MALLIFVVYFSALILTSAVEHASPTFLVMHAGLCVLLGASAAIVLPIINFGGWIKRRWDICGFGAYSLAAAIVPGLLSLFTYWRGFCFPRTPFSIMTLMTLFSLIFYYLERRMPGIRICASEEKPESPFPSSSVRVLFIILMAGFCICVSIPFIQMGYYGSEGVAYPSIGDYNLHGGIIARLAFTGLPADNPFIAHEPLRYSYFFHLLTADLVIVSGWNLNVHHAYVLILAFFVGVFMCNLFFISWTWTHSSLGALGTVIFSTWIAGLDAIPMILFRLNNGFWLRGVDGWENYGLFKIHAPITNFLYLPHHLLAVLMFLIIIYFVTSAKNRLQAMIVCALLFGVAVGSSVVIAIAAIWIIAIMFLLLYFVRFLQCRTLTLSLIRCYSRELLIWLFIFSIGCALVSPLLLLIGEARSFEGSPRLQLSLPSLDTVEPSIFQFKQYPLINKLIGLVFIELLDFSPMIIFALLGIAFVKVRCPSMARPYLIYIPLISLFLLNCVAFQGGAHPNEWSMKVGQICGISLSILAGFGLAKLACSGSLPVAITSYFREQPVSNNVHVLSKRWYYSVISTLLGIMVLLGALGTFYEVSSKANPVRISPELYGALLYIRDKLPRTAIVQKGIHDDVIPGITLMGWRASVLTEPNAVKFYFADPKEAMRREAILKSAFESGEPAVSHRMLKDVGVDYLLWTPSEDEHYGSALRQRLETAHGLFSPVYSKCGILILKVE